ncbi:MAG: LuxR C-terminal-related transcriptional regulator, partial [Actinobacteria bacterium]|nr:LuxR C-terminal-related transcriptional regulator [Actinomycetota bacterium]
YQGRAAEARAAMERALDGAYECNDPLLEAYAVGFLSDSMLALGDYEATGAVILRTAVRLRRSLDVCREGFVEFGLARLALASGDLVEAARQTAALAGMTRRAGLPILIEWLCQLEGRIALEQGDLTRARSALEELASFVEGLGIPWSLAGSYHLRGLLARAEGDPGAAEDLHHQALALQHRYSFRGAATATLEALASLATAADAKSEAARLYGAAHSLRESTGQTRWPLDRPAYEGDLTRIRDGLGEEQFDRAWSEGAALSLKEVVSYASRARGERKRPRSGWAALTPTELEVTALAGQGLTNPQIGQRLFISAGTVRIHLSHIYAKLGIANRAQLAAEATSRGLIERPLSR